MLPDQLTAGQFTAYPPEARALAAQHIQLFRALPLGFLPLLLRELIAYDWKFPAERTGLDDQLAYLSVASEAEIRSWMAPFAQLKLSEDLERLDWVNSPAQFSEKLSAYLWATHQMDAFRTASIAYVHRLETAKPEPGLPLPRFSAAIIGHGVAESNYRLFRKLRPHGVHYTNVNAASGFSDLTAVVNARSVQLQAPFAHWYVDGDEAPTMGSGISSVSYASLRPAREALINKMVKTMQPGGGGPELLRTELASMQPSELGLPSQGNDAVLSRFEMSLLTEGSGTQIFSTTFVQWAAREVLRRAQPATLLARFTPRKREAVVANPNGPVPTDPAASLIDADMGAYYMWISQQRLAHADKSVFVVWFENHKEALVIAPSLPRGVSDPSDTSLGKILSGLQLTA